MSNFYSYFQALLHFIYCDSLPDMEDVSGLSTKCASTLMTQHLLAAADCYALDRLKVLCEAKLCQDVAINTVATTLALADQHHCFQLKSVCLKFVALPENLRGITNIHLINSLSSEFFFFSPYLFEEVRENSVFFHSLWFSLLGCTVQMSMNFRLNVALLFCLMFSSMECNV